MSDNLQKSADTHVLATPGGGTYLIPAAMAETLLRQGIAPTVVTVPEVVHHAKVTWENLCVLPTRDRKTMVSPIIAITLIDANLEASQEFNDYRGVVRFEFTTEYGYTQFATHAMTYADTGELTPLWAWLTVQKTPFLARLAYIETRNTERHVVRPVPLDTEIV